MIHLEKKWIENGCISFAFKYRIITIASFSPFSHSTLINIHYSSLIIGINLAMEMSYIRMMTNFPILVKTPLIFLGPIPKKGSESPGLI